jgi:NAD(P)-dependent dehydrogenase (short-subunit alcohol dehydrogenase family)
MKHVVIIGIESAIGAAVAGLYRSAGARVMGASLDRDVEAKAAALGNDPIDILIFADAFTAPSCRATELKRGDFEAALSQLAFAPFRLANLLRPALAANSGARLVLLTRSAAAMTHPDPNGAYLVRPFRAAAHALWKSMSVEWQTQGIDCLVIAIDDATEADAALLATIDATKVPPEGCVLMDRHGKTLGW